MNFGAFFFFARFQHHKRSLDLVEALMANG